MKSLLGAPRATDADVVHAVLDSLDPGEWSEVSASYGVADPKGQTAMNRLFGKIMARATGDRRFDYDAWSAEDYSALYGDAN